MRNTPASRLSMLSVSCACVAYRSAVVFAIFSRLLLNRNRNSHFVTVSAADKYEN